MSEENAVIQNTPTEPLYGSQDALKKTTDDFVNQLDNGSIIAVQTAYNKAVSVTVISHERDAEGNVTRCKAKGRDDTIYDVPRKAIIWHKINKRYPAWVYEKIKNGEGDIYAKIDKTADVAGTGVGASE